MLREPLRKYADILAQFDVDLLVLAGRTRKLEPVRRLFVSEMPVSPPRIKTMARLPRRRLVPVEVAARRGASRTRSRRVAAGATILHLAQPEPPARALARGARRARAAADLRALPEPRAAHRAGQRALPRRRHEPALPLHARDDDRVPERRQPGDGRLAALRGAARVGAGRAGAARGPGEDHVRAEGRTRSRSARWRASARPTRSRRRTSGCASRRSRWTATGSTPGVLRAPYRAYDDEEAA